MSGWEDGVGAPGDRDGIPPRWSRQPDDTGSWWAADDDVPAWLGDLLRDEAARHEPDRERILALMAERERAEYAAPATVSSLDNQRRGAARNPRPGNGVRARRVGLWAADTDRQQASARGRFAWPLVAASIAVLTITTVAGAGVLAPGEGSDTVTVQPQASSSTGASSLGVPVTIDKPNPSTSPTPSATAPSTPVAPPGPTGAASSRGEQPPAVGSLSGAVSLQVRPVSDGVQLGLPQSNADRDWIVVGGRPDRRLIRAKHPTRTLGSVTVSGSGPAVVEGPYRISWQDALPEPDRANNTTWQSISAVDGRIRVTVPLQGDRLRIDLYAGTVRTAGKVSVRAPGSSEVVSATLPLCGRGICPDIVTVSVESSRLPGGGRSGDLVIELGPAQPGGQSGGQSGGQFGGQLGLGLAAVILH